MVPPSAQTDAPRAAAIRRRLAHILSRSGSRTTVPAPPRYRRRCAERGRLDRFGRAVEAIGRTLVVYGRDRCRVSHWLGCDPGGPGGDVLRRADAAGPGVPLARTR